MSISNHGRRILKWKTEKGIVHTLSGQWVGHLYGDEWGTDRQRKNASPSKDAKLIAISGYIFWNFSGYAGERYEDCLKNLDFIKVKKKKKAKKSN